MCLVILEKLEGKNSIKVDVQPVVPGWDDWLVNSERRMNRVEGRQ